MIENVKIVQKLFLPFYERRISDLQQNGIKLVHYTSAYATLSILENKEIWMRSTACMNDFQEVKYGEKLFQNFFHSDRYGDFKNALGPDLAPALDEARKIAESWFQRWPLSTYICSLSEHPKEEDTLGRLSMWRGYGKNTGIAIVFKPDIFISDFDLFPIYTSPVEYMTEDDFKKAVDVLIGNVKENRELVSILSPTELSIFLVRMIRYGSVSIKHPGFKEEKEWRIIAELDNSAPLKIAVQDVGGIPQIILKIPLTEGLENGKAGFSINRNLDHIIIGPTPYPAVIAEALVRELKKCGVTHAEQKVIASDIPFRG